MTKIRTLASALLALATVTTAPALASVQRSGDVRLAASNLVREAASDADASCKTGCWAQGASARGASFAQSIGRKLDMESAGILN